MKITTNTSSAETADKPNGKSEDLTFKQGCILAGIIIFVVYWVLFFLFGSLTAFGLASYNNEAVGQVKYTKNIHPIIYPNYTELHLSLGVMRNNVGSISKEDITLYVPNESDVIKLNKSAEEGKLVKVIYDNLRFSFWYPNAQVRSVEILD